MKTIRIGGREFKPVVQSTVEHDFTLMGHIEAAGLAPAVRLPGESADDFANRLMSSVISSGKIFPILGCVFVPADMDELKWTPETGKETEAFLKRLSEPEDKAAINQQVAALLLNFYLTGIASVKSSPNSSPGSPG